MGNEENKVTEETTVADIVSEQTQIVETEESNDSGCSLKQAIGVAGIATAMIGAGYGLYRLGKAAFGMAKGAYEDYKAKKYIDSLEDDEFDDEPIEEAPVEEKPEFPDHKKKQK